MDRYYIESDDYGDWELSESQDGWLVKHEDVLVLENELTRLEKLLSEAIWFIDNGSLSPTDTRRYNMWLRDNFTED